MFLEIFFFSKIQYSQKYCVKTPTKHEKFTPLSNAPNGNGAQPSSCLHSER